MINIEEFVCTYSTGNNIVNSEPIKAAATFRKFKIYYSKNLKLCV